MKKKQILEDVICNFDIIEYFMTGQKQNLSEFFICEGVLQYDSYNNFDIAIKSGKFIVINGDEYDGYESGYDINETIEELQNCSKDVITTSFTCLKNAGVVVSDMQVIDITQDRSNYTTPKKKNFKNFEKTVPQGATYKERRNFIKKTGKPSGAIYEKSYHIAGSMLIKYKNSSYICGMDDDSYFISKLKTNPKSVDAAFKSLKPRRVLKYEKDSGKFAQRQGEWFFIPSDIKLDPDSFSFHNVDLPKEKGGNSHTVNKYILYKGKHYCESYVSHKEHGTLTLNSVCEAIQNTALASWSVVGVD